MKAEQRWWHTADKQHLVPEADPRAALLAYAVGDEISAADADRLPQPAAEPAPEKAAPQAPNKGRKPTANK